MSSEDTAHRKRNNYKLIVDPELQKGKKKLYRINGAIPGHPSIAAPTDPRVQKTVLGVAEYDFKLPVPRFKYDKFWEGSVPQRDVFVMGLTDPSQVDVLKEAASNIGPLYGVKLHRHPKTKAFLGAATIMYFQTGCGRKAVPEFDGKIVAGCYLRAELDDKGEHLRNFMDPFVKDLRRPTTDKKPGQLCTTTHSSTSTSNTSPHSGDVGNGTDANSSDVSTPRIPDTHPQRSNLFFSPSLSVQTSASLAESPSSTGCFSPSFTPCTPSSIDSGISLNKTSFDPMLALRSLNLLPPPQPKELQKTKPSSPSSSSSLPPLPPEGSSPVPPPPPSVDVRVENISSDEEDEKERLNGPAVSRVTLTDLLSPISLSSPPSIGSPDCGVVAKPKVVVPKNSFISTFVPVPVPEPARDPRLNRTNGSKNGSGKEGGGEGGNAGGGGGGGLFGIEVEEISGDESPVMLYHTHLHVEQISSDEGDGETAKEGRVSDDMEISDDDTNQTNVIEVNVRSISKSYTSLPQYPPVPPSLPPLPPTFPLPPAPGYYPPPPPLQSSHPPFLPPLPPHNLLPPTMFPPPLPFPAAQTGTPVQSKLPAALPVNPEKVSQDVLVKALEQLAAIVHKDMERKLVESAAFPELDSYWEKRSSGDSKKEVVRTHNDETGEEERSVKPPEPYRRMLPGMVVTRTEEEEGANETPITPRKKLINFKIPLLNRSTQRRSHHHMARRRLYEDDEREIRRKDGRQRHKRSVRLTGLSDISSEDFSDDDSEEERRRRRRTRTKRRRRSSLSSSEFETSDEEDEILAGPHTPPPEDAEVDISEEEEEEEGEDEESEEKEEEDEEIIMEEEEEEEVNVDDDEDEEEWSLNLELMSRRDTKRRNRRVSSSTIMPDEKQFMVAPEKEKEESKLRTTVNHKIAEPVVEKLIPTQQHQTQARRYMFKKRPLKAEEEILRLFLGGAGVDKEDVRMMRQALVQLIDSGDQLVTNVIWSHYPSVPSYLPPSSKRRKVHPYEDGLHSSGSARCEGYYKIDQRDKSYLPHLRRNTLGLSETTEQQQSKKSGRGNRLNHRRVASLFGSGDMSREVQQYNQLKARKKQLKFAKSTIHNWGLFALENISADEMVIEYVGELVRQTVADDRERRYEAQGIGSSYLFRVDHDYIIDATRRGNMARFINHCCDPNCYARVISIGTQKKIVIYSKRDIAMGEEITYDYKFPIEDEKIPCLCGAPNCRGTLN